MWGFDLHGPNRFFAKDAELAVSAYFAPSSLVLIGSSDCLSDLYFTWLASPQRIAARSNSFKEVMPNFSFTRAQ